MSDSAPKKRKLNGIEMIFVFAAPMIIGKSLVAYFGAEYSSNPGEGYGYGLAASIVFTLASLGSFIYRYRDS